MAVTIPTSEGPLAVERRLDEWYLTIGKLYLGRNFYRTASSLLAHLVEVCAAMGTAARSDWVPPSSDSSEVVAKSVAWWFAVCSKVGLYSPEDILWAKFPAVCSYCHQCPHDAKECEFQRKRILATHGELAPDWDELERLALSNITARPSTLADFVDMFLRIYGEPSTNFAPIFARLNEELGELAEAVRVSALAPHYFLSEAPDVFAWLMQCHAFFAREREAVRENWGELLATNMVAMYPDMCRDCDSDPCRCAPVLRKNLGRLAVAGPKHHAKRLGPGRSFLPLEDQLKAIEEGTGTINVSGRDFRVDAPGLTDFASDLDVLRTEIERVGADQREQLGVILVELKGVASAASVRDEQLEILTAGIEGLGDLIAAQPDPKRQQVLDFLNGLASNLVAAVILSATR